MPSTYQDMDDDKGTSCILTLTDKGRSLFERISNQIISRKIDKEVIFQGNGRLISPTKPHPSRKEFFDRVQNEQESFSQLLYEYIGPQNNRERVKFHGKMLLKNLGLYKFKHSFRMYQRKKYMKNEKVKK